MDFNEFSVSSYIYIWISSGTYLGIDNTERGKSPAG